MKRQNYFKFLLLLLLTCCMIVFCSCGADVKDGVGTEAPNENIGEGTDTNPEKGWSRTGTLAGTSALVKYFPDGECWILITNTSTWKGPGLPRYTDELFRNCRKQYGDKLPKQDLFTTQPTITITEE